MSDPVKVIAETVAYNKKLWWVRVPRSDKGSVILTLPRDQLAHGFAQYQFLRVRLDYATLHHDGHGWTAALVIEEGLGDKRTMDPGKGALAS